MHHRKAMLYAMVLMFCMNNAFGLAILEKLDQTTELNKLSTAQRIEGRHQLISMLVHCEFSETCLVQMIDDLKTLQEKSPNPMYQVYSQYLQAKKPELLGQATRCDIPEKKEVRKIIAECLHQMVTKEESMKIVDRKMTDKLQDERDQCVKAKIEDVAKSGNLFAQAMLVNIYEQARDNKKFDYWYNEMQKKADTKEFKAYLACPDIP
jgi:hypothetical protein